MQSVKLQADNDWAFRVSPGLAAELDEFQKTVEQFRTGAIS